MTFPSKKQLQILSSLGLSQEMDELPSISTFKKYVTDEYRKSNRRETDEVYDMYEINLLHRLSGIRLTLTSREDYFGDVVYKVIRLFITTKTKEDIELTDVNFENQIFHTPDVEIPFSLITLDI